MSLADEMLLKQGFKLERENEDVADYNSVTFSFDALTFYKSDKYIFHPSGNITLEMLKAINEKAKELGWFDE